MCVRDEYLAHALKRTRTAERHLDEARKRAANLEVNRLLDVAELHLRAAWEAMDAAKQS